MHRLNLASLLGLALFLAAGCNIPHPPATTAPLPSTLPGHGEPAPAKELTRVRDTTYALPGMDCLVNDHGIRVKVLPTRPDVACLDSVPAGPMKGRVARQFHPYFVFDVYPRQGELSFYQVGTTPRRDSIVGWVPAAAVCRWDTRVGARYRRIEGGRVPPLLIYRGKEPLLEILRTGSTSVAPLARAVARAERTRMPWPIAEVEQVTLDGQVYELVRLDFLGEFKEGSTPEPVASASPARSYSAGEVQQIQTGVRMLDVVFVLDVTGSMGPYIEAANDTVRDISRRLKDLDFKPDIACGLVAYRDYDAESGFVTKPFDLETDYQRFLTSMGTLKAAAGGDTQEAVYDGVLDALEKTTWRGQGLSARVLVLIGDASAHEPGDPQNPRNLSRDRLVEQARQRGVKVFALATGKKEGNADWDRMWRQFTDLSARTGGQCVGIDNAGAVVERVRQVLQAESATVKQRADVVDELAQGRSVDQIATERDLDIHKVIEVLEFLQGAGVDVRRFGTGVPSFATGWALCELHGVPILDREVYVARPELDVLLASLNLLCSKLSPDFGRQIYGLGIGSRVNPLTSFFDEDVPEPLDVYLMTKGIPVGRSSILRLTAAEIRYMSEERRAALRERIARRVIPDLVAARNDDSLWSFRDDLEFGWIPEAILP
jgi:hypothetical protein